MLPQFPFLSPRNLRWVWIAYALVLFVATHTPLPPSIGEIVSTWDKVIHFLAFFGLSLLTSLAWTNWRTLQMPVMVLAIGLPLYCALDEFLQGFVGRTPDIKDWYSDTAGSWLAIGVVVLLLRWRRANAVAPVSPSNEPLRQPG